MKIQTNLKKKKFKGKSSLEKTIFPFKKKNKKFKKEIVLSRDDFLIFKKINITKNWKSKLILKKKFKGKKKIKKEIVSSLK